MIRLLEYHKKFSPHKTPVFPRMNCSFLRIKLQFTPEKTFSNTRSPFSEVGRLWGKGVWFSFGGKYY